MEKLFLGEFKRGDKIFSFNEIELSDESLENIENIIESSLRGSNQNIEITVREMDVNVKKTVYSLRGELYDSRELYIEKINISEIINYGTCKVLKCYIPEGKVRIN
jgi:hypothetical protein